MLEQIIYPALLRLTRAFPLTAAGRLNSFGVVASFKDVDADNLNASMQDGRIGHYWGRAWEASGKQGNMVMFENALLFVRPEAFSLPDLREVCQVIEIGIASLPECEGCPGKRNDIQVETGNANILQKILKEITEIQPYLVTIPAGIGGVGLATYWLTPGEVAWMKTNAVVFPNLRKCDSYISVKINAETLASFPYGTSGMIVTTAKLKVCWCETETPVFDFRRTDFNQAAYSGCSTC